MKVCKKEMNKLIALALGRSGAEALLFVLILGFAFLAPDHPSKDHWTEVAFYSMVGLFLPLRSFMFLRAWCIRRRPTV